MSTPIKPVQDSPKRITMDQRTAWVKALDSLDKSRPVKFGQHYETETRTDADGNKIKVEIGDPAVWLVREADPQYVTTAFWTKAYVANAARDLRVFNFHERDMLGYLKNTQHCYHLIGATETNITSLARLTGGLTANLPPFAMRTTDKGTSIKQWMEWPVMVGQVRHDHIFRLAGHYLRFARGALIALDELHSKRVSHLDLNASNWTLEATFAQLTDGAQRLRLCPEWSNVSIIDVGYSIHPDKMPPVQLPLDTTYMSERFAEACQHSYTDGEDAFDRLTAQEKRNNGWSDYKDVLYVRDFWATHAPTALSAYKTIDWREDYLRLGQVLKSMRGGRQKKDEGTCERIPGVESKVWCSVGAVNKFIGESAFEGNATGISGLAEELIGWGNKATSYDGNSNDKIRLEASKAEREKTHAALLHRLDAVIALLTPEDDAQYVFLMRKDIEPGYRDQLKAEEEEKKRADQEKKEAAKKKAEQDAQRKALWLARAKQAARGSILIAGLASVVGAGAYGYDNWLKPTLVSWQKKQQQNELAEQKKKEAAAAEVKRLAREAAAQAQATTQRVQAAQQSVQRADFGSAPWRSAIAQLATLCQQPQPGAAVPATTPDCTAAFTQVQQDYLRASPQTQKDPWWIEGHFDTQPPVAMRNWLFATRALADQGLWVAQVNQAMASTVAAARKVPYFAPSREDQLAAARTLATLITPERFEKLDDQSVSGRTRSLRELGKTFNLQQSPASVYAVVAPPEAVRALRVEAADLLWSLHREGEGQHGNVFSSQLAPTELALPVVHAVADLPNQAAQAMLAYSLICWTDKPDEAQAMAYFAKAEVAQNGNNQVIADKAKAMRLAHQNGGQLCQK